MGRCGWRVRLLVAALVVASVAAVVVALYPRPTFVVPDRGGTYTEAITAFPKSINPILASADSLDSDLSRLVFNGLTKIDDSGVPTPDLASSWTTTTDNRSYTFSLRKGVRWQDGVAFGPDDVLFTIAAMQDPAYQGLPELAQLWRNIRVEAVDDHTVRFQLVDAYAPFPEFASVGILPAHLLKSVPVKDLATTPFGARPVGTGPFRVTSVTSDEISLEASPDYFGPAPYLSSLRFKLFGDQSKAVAALRRQEAQGIRGVTADDIPAVQQVPTLQLHSTPDYSKLTLLVFNTRAALANEKIVRQAVSLAIDRRRLIDVVSAGQGALAPSPITAATRPFAAEVGGMGYEPEAARSLLDAAGWIVASDGIRRRGDIKLNLILLTNDKPLRIRTAEEIARQLAEVGIGTQVQAAGWSGFLQDFLVPRKFQIALTEQWSPNFDPDVYPFWHSSQIANGLNFSSWTNRRADEVLENARRSSDPQVRRSLYEEFQSIFAEDAPGVPLTYPMYHMAVDKSVQGVRLGSLVQSSDRFSSINDWYIKTKRVSIPPAGS